MRITEKMFSEKNNPHKKVLGQKNEKNVTKAISIYITSSQRGLMFTGSSNSRLT